MKTVRLNGTQLTNRQEALELLGQALDLPEWWGRNLDALYDCLTEPGRAVRLELSDRAAMEAAPFGRLLLRVLKDAAAAGTGLEITDAE